jgi:hypothetical protein
MIGKRGSESQRYGCLSCGAHSRGFGTRCEVCGGFSFEPITEVPSPGVEEFPAGPGRSRLHAVRSPARITTGSAESRRRIAGRMRAI